MLGYEQRRTFLNFNFFHRKERVEKDADMDPGLEKMMELRKRERMRARMPSIEEVRKALKDFFDSKNKRKSPMTDNQASLALQSLRYALAETAKLDAAEGRVEPDSAWRDRNSAGVATARRLLLRTLALPAATAMRRLPEQVSDSHVQLAKLLFDSVEPWQTQEHGRWALAAYVTTLAHTGSTLAAKLLMEKFESTFSGGKGTEQKEALNAREWPEAESVDQEDGTEMDDSNSAMDTLRFRSRSRAFLRQTWIVILEGFVREENDVEVQQTLSEIQDHGFADAISVARAMVDFCIGRNDLAAMRQWWNAHRQAMFPHDNEHAIMTAATLQKILNWCQVQGELKAGHEFVKEALKENPEKALWDVIFVWAASTGKGVDEIDRMIGVMEKSNETLTDQAHFRIPDVETINALVKVAVNKKDPYMAERFITMGQNRSIEPNAQTYVLQMDYRLSVNDVDGALIAYKSLQGMDNSSNEDVPTVNKLLVALCQTQRHDFDTIMNVAADLSDRKARFEAATVSALAALHLNRDEANDVIDLLNTHAYHYSTAERDFIRDTILNMSLDAQTPTSRAWNCYLIIYNHFDETPRPQRTELMTAFMSRSRADMGVRIFQQMRAHSRADTMPTTDTYVAAFLGLAKIRELDPLEVIHNQLKLDYNVLPTTYLYNALMLAYIACGDANHGLNFWNDIVASKEGPSYNSIHIALRACEKTAFGDLKAREIWSLLRRRNVELDHHLWCSYLAALCGNGNVDQSLNATEEAEVKGELAVDEFLVGSLCDATPKYAEKQGMIEEWAQDRYPDAWRKLNEEVGFEILPTGVKKFKVDRRVSPS